MPLPLVNFNLFLSFVRNYYRTGPSEQAHRQLERELQKHIVKPAEQATSDVRAKVNIFIYGVATMKPDARPEQFETFSQMYARYRDERAEIGEDVTHVQMLQGLIIANIPDFATKSGTLTTSL